MRCLVSDLTITNLRFFFSSQNIKTQDVANVVVSGEKTLISGDKEEKVVDHWVQGVVYDGKQERFEGSRDLNLKRPGCLLDDERGCWLSKSRPLYREAAIEDFINARTIGTAGDGKTDDAASLQGAVDKAARDGKILYSEWKEKILLLFVYSTFSGFSE